MSYVFTNIHLVVALFFHLTHGGPICLSCTDVPLASNCRYTQTCSDHEICYTDTFVTPDGFITTNVGCRDTQQCQSTQGRRSLNESRDARASNNMQVCSDCCQGDICNSALCGQQGFVPKNMRGPLCYDCDYQLYPNSCNVFSMCYQGEICELNIDRRVGNGNMFSSSCQTEMRCHVLSQLSSMIGKRATRSNICISCCSGDLCNNKCPGPPETNISTTRAATGAPTTVKSFNSATTAVTRGDMH